jgi:excisionase family DNA binding protein
VKHPLGENSEQARMTKPRVPQPSRQVISFGSEPSNAGTLADQIASYKGALTARQLSERLSISAITIYKMAKRGALPSFRVAGCVRFCPSTVARWLRERGG